MRSRRGRAIGAVVAVCALLAAGCGDDDTDEAGAGEASTGEEAGGGAVEDLQIVTEPPTEFTVNDPLPGPPEARSVAFLVCPVPACEKNVTYLTNAAEVLGWDIEAISLDLANPGVAFQQALDGGFDYIALTGVPLAALEEQMAEARDRGIPVFECYSTDVAEGEANGLYSQCGGAESVALSADRLADWVIEDSGGDANVVAVTIRDFPILVAGHFWPCSPARSSASRPSDSPNTCRSARYRTARRPRAHPSPPCLQTMRSPALRASKRSRKSSRKTAQLRIE